MILVPLTFVVCFMVLILCRFVMATPYRELARLGVVWMSIVSLIIFLAWYEEASLWTLILMFATPVAVIHVAYVVVSYWRQQRAKRLEARR